MQPGPGPQPPIQICQPVSAQCLGQRQGHPGLDPEGLCGAGAEVFGVTQKVWVGVLETWVPVLGRWSAGTLDWGC